MLGWIGDNKALESICGFSHCLQCVVKQPAAFSSFSTTPSFHKIPHLHLLQYLWPQVIGREVSEGFQTFSLLDIKWGRGSAWSHTGYGQA